MPLMKLSLLATLLQASLKGRDAAFEFVSTDSRSLQKGELFIALKGPYFNGHDFIEEVQKKGAVAAIVSEPIETSLPTLLVRDTRIALGTLAAARRSQTNIPLVGITGSCGKTTTKTMIASILSQTRNVLSTEGTLNNDIGVPLTLLRLTPQHLAAVIEMGANHPGEIAYVAKIAQPNIGVITNVAPVHLEGFGDLNTVARTKGELFENLAHHGTAIINADDNYANYWIQQNYHRKTVTFSVSSNADVVAKEISLDSEGHALFDLHTSAGKIAIKLPVLGLHNVSNALAASAAALQLGVSLDEIKQGLETMTPVPKRSIPRKGLQGSQIIDDTYNSNPMAFRAALQLLSHAQGPKIVVMGDMGELGENAKEYHEEVGREAKKYGVYQFFAVGELSRFSVLAFGEGGNHFNTQQALIAAIKPMLTSGMTVLVKGSRSAKMENVVNALVV